MNFTECFNCRESILMEGALGERLKREYHLNFDPNVVMASLVYSEKGRQALKQSFNCNDVVYNRFLGIQANTSPLPYDELDHAKDLKTSDPSALAEEMMKLRENNHIKIFGGCCGTDGRHMKEIARRM